MEKNKAQLLTVWRYKSQRKQLARDLWQFGRGLTKILHEKVIIDLLTK